MNNTDPCLNNATCFLTMDFNNTTVEDILNNTTHFGYGGLQPTSRRQVYSLGGEVRIPLFSIIFILAVVGNILVIVTLVQHKKMRTITNVFLLNLAVSDLLFAVFCMPFTLVPQLLRNFIFGAVMCVMIRYLQGKLCLLIFVFKCHEDSLHAIIAMWKGKERIDA